MAGKERRGQEDVKDKEGWTVDRRVFSVQLVGAKQEHMVKTYKHFTYYAGNLLL